MMNLGGDQIDDLWDGLNLGGLLNDLQKENDLLLKNKKAKDPFYKHNKVVESPAYNVLMERYHTRPPQPKMLSKKTLDRLSDPVKGRIYESPPKESKNNNSNNNNNNNNNKTSIDFRTKIKPEKIDKDINKSNNKKLPIRYHSPIRQDYNSPDDESILSGGENSPTNNNVNRKDADSFFLTGTMHGEVNQNSGVSSYHPVMDVRIDVENSKKKKEKKYGDDMNDNIDDIYTARTRTYLQEALLRGQSANNGINQSRESRTKKKNGNNEHNFSKEMNAKKIKTIKTKPTLLKKEKSLGNKRSKNDPLLSRPQNIKNQKLSSSNRNSQNNIETSKIEKSTKWASSRDIPLTKPGSRKLLAPVAGIQTKKSSSKNKKLIPSKDNLIGLERVDEEYSQLRSETLLRSNSSSLPTRDLNNKQQLQSQSQLNSNSNSKLRNNNSNLIGSRSAPTLSSRKTNSLYDETSDNETPAYRVHAPVPSRLLSKGGIIKKSQLPSLDKNKKSNITLPPIDSIQSKPSSTSLLPSSTSLLRSNISQGKSNNFNGRPPLPSSSSGITSSSTTTSSINGGISRSNSKPFSSSSTSMTQIDPSDDHMAAVFAAHAKKLTDNLEKASNLSMKYKQLKEYDGIIAANRGDTNLLLPNRNPNSNNVTNNVSNNGNGNENVNNVGDINLDPIVEKKPERYSIII